MLRHQDMNSTQFRQLFRRKFICLAGNLRLKIYGHLHCASGKRMKKSKRVFFHSVEEAAALGFRPCGLCMHHEFQKWRNGSV